MESLPHVSEVWALLFFGFIGGLARLLLVWVERDKAPVAQRASMGVVVAQNICFSLLSVALVYGNLAAGQIHKTSVLAAFEIGLCCPLILAGIAGLADKKHVSDSAAE